MKPFIPVEPTHNPPEIIVIDDSDEDEPVSGRLSPIHTSPSVQSNSTKEHVPPRISGTNQGMSSVPKSRSFESNASKDRVTPTKEYKCFHCKHTATRSICTRSVKNKGKPYYECKNTACVKDFLFWAPKTTTAGPLPRMFSAITHSSAKVQSIAPTPSGEPEVTDLIETVFVQETETETSDPDLVAECVVCCETLIQGESATCTVCAENVHTSTDCSIPDRNHIHDGRANEALRVCRMCLCTMCKWPRKEPHDCICVVCRDSNGTLSLCANCQQPAHANCKSIASGRCNNCLLTQGKYMCTLKIPNILPHLVWLLFIVFPGVGVPASDIQVLRSDEMLAESIICTGMDLLQSQFPKIMGLAPPISCEEVLVKWAAIGEEHNTYKPCMKDQHYIQILSTGSEHWVTAFKPKGSDSNIFVLNSTGALRVGSFVEQQLALIMDCAKPTFTVSFSDVKKQEGSINQCGPLALAYATEIAFTGSVSYVDFKLDELRPHLLECILERKMNPFPRLSEPRVSRVIARERVNVLCNCRLPQHFDERLIYCSKCRRWCHFKCHDITEEPTARRWLCKCCTSAC